MTYRIQEISSLSVEEWVNLKASLYALENREFYCGDCLSKYEGRVASEEMSKKARDLKGCFGLKDRQLHHIERKIYFYTCIGNFFRESVLHWLDMFRAFDKGVMPYQGNLMDQPNKVIEIFRVIESYKQDKMVTDQKREQGRQRVTKGGRR